MTQAKIALNFLKKSKVIESIFNITKTDNCIALSSNLYGVNFFYYDDGSILVQDESSKELRVKSRFKFNCKKTLHTN